MNKIIHLKFLSLKKGVIIFFILFSIVNFASATPIEILMQQNKVTIKMTNKPVKAILTEIYRQTKINFIFKNEKEIASLSSVSINVINASVTETLDQLFKGTDFTYKIEDNVVTIIKKEVSTSQPSTKKSDRIFVGGKVIDKVTKKPIVGATVIVINKPSGGITDASGAFTFMANSDDALEISFVGKKTITYNQSLKQNLIFEMEDDVVGLDDVVVTGYANVNRKDMVGATTTLKAGDIQIAGKTNIAEMLQGQVAGMIVTNSSARAGATPKIQIRGQSTLSSELGNQNPIWVVDGVIQDEPIKMNYANALTNDMETLIGNQVSWLNPSDIETITILKDASATAIYGSRATNGVIVVTTKKPTSEKISVSYSGSVTINERANYDKFNYMNSQERIMFTEELFNAGAVYDKAPVKQQNTFDGLLRSYIERDITYDQYSMRRSELEVINTDWFNILTRAAVSQNHNVSLTGKISDKLSVVGSVGYTRKNGQEIKNNMDNFTSRIALNAQISKRIRINLSINGSKSKNTGTAVGIASGGGGSTPLEYAKKTSRSIPAYNSDGSPASYLVPSKYTYNILNPLSYNFINEMNETRSINNSGRFSVAMQGTLTITEWLSYEVSGNYTFTDTGRETYRSERSFSIANQYRGYDYGTALPNSDYYNAALLPHGGVIDNEDATGNSYNIQNKLIFSKSFEKHRFNAMLANEIRSNKMSNKANAMWGYMPDRGNKFTEPPKRITPITGSFSETDYGLLGALYDGRYYIYEKEDNFVSLFATFAYNFDSRYVLNANVRNDMSNRFGQDINNRFDPTYSFGFKWNITNEHFLKDRAMWLDNLNFSATYGIQGNALLTKSSDLILTKGNISKYYQEFVSNVFSIPNPYLTWERTKNWNFSLAGTVFKSLNFNIDYYWRKSNASVAMEIGFENGVSSINMNGGIIYNSGIEGTISFNPKITKDLGLLISINGSKNWNKGGKTSLTDANKIKTSSYLSPKTNIIAKEGYPIGSFWAYQFSHLDDEKGTARFRKMDVDPEIAALDPTAVMVYAGESTPFFTGGLNFGIKFKNVTLNSTFAMILGGKTVLASPYSELPFSINIPAAEVNLSKDLLKRWKKSGDERTTYYPAITAATEMQEIPGQRSSETTISMWANSDLNVVNAGFLRCSDVSLTYNFQNSLIEKVGLSNLSVSGSVSNLFVIGSKRFNGFDPELGTSVMPRTFSISLNIGF